MIHIEKIDPKNVWEVIDLKLRKDQKNFVCSNSVSIIQAYTAKETKCSAFPFAVFNGKKVVGFLMVCYNEGAFYEIYGEEIECHVKSGLIIESEDSLKLSDRGIDISNFVLSSFIRG